MAKKPRINRDLVIIASLSVVIVTFWIGIATYLSLKTSTIPQVLQEQLKPLQSGFDTQVLNNLNLRKRISGGELENLPPRRLTLGTETQLTQQPTSTVAARLSAPESSPAAGLSQ